MRAHGAANQYLASTDPIAPNDCVCVQFKYSEDGVPYDLSVPRTTSAEAASTVVAAIETAAPYGQIPSDASCLLDESIYRSVGGSRLPPPANRSVSPPVSEGRAERIRECLRTADRLAARGLDDYARQFRATCPDQ
jgi:hypothetical protein